MEARKKNELLNCLNVLDEPTEMNINTKETAKGHNLKFIPFNVNVLRGKKLEMQAFLDTEKPDVVAI